MTLNKVLLINPHGFESTQGGSSNPPLGLFYLAGMLRKHFIRVDVIDGFLVGYEGIKRSLVTFKPDLVGISCLTPGRHKALECARLSKTIFPSVPVVLGGADATIRWKQILQNYPEVDVCALGEGEKTLLEIAQGKSLYDIKGIAFRNYPERTEIIRTAPRELLEIDAIPFPTWDFLEDSLKYIHGDSNESFNGVNLGLLRVPIIFSRGCPGHCYFCSSWWIWRKHRCRSPKNMVDEIERLYEFGYRHFVFEDDTMTYDQDKSEGLMDEIKKRKLKIAFYATTRVDCVNLTLLKKMREAGCYGIAYGVETACPQILKALGKDDVTIAQAEQAIKWTHEARIKVNALIINAPPGETPETWKKTRDFLKRLKVESIGNVGALWILPGVHFYSKAKRAGVISDDFWLGKEPYFIYKKGMFNGA